MKFGRLALVPILFSSLYLTSCIQNVPKSYAPINGNWHIAGGEDYKQYPLLTLAIGVNGSAIYGSGDVGADCSGGSSAIGGSLAVSGQVAADGTFVLENVFPLNSIQVVIRGTVPAPGSTSWMGSYTITNSTAQMSCIFNISGDFVATAYPALNGNYAGTILGQGLSPGISVSTQVMQGAFTSLPRLSPNPPLYYTPLNAAIAVTGSSCFTSGTAATNPLSSVSGDMFMLNYAMDDGSSLNLSGVLTDPSESSLQVQFWFILGGKCDGVSGFGGILTRQ